jgi:hypothetical protein
MRAHTHTMKESPGRRLHCSGAEAFIKVGTDVLQHLLCGTQAV